MDGPVYNQPVPTPRLIACPDCDLLQRLPDLSVDIAAIRRKYHAAAIEQERQDRRGSTGTRRAKAVAEKK